MNAWHWRAVLYGSFLIACLVVIWPPYTRNGEPGKIKLGLDLRGGTYLVLQVMGDDIPAAGKPPVAPDTVKEVIRTLERRVNQLGVADPVITEYGAAGDQILVQLPGVKDVAQAKRLLISVAQLSLHIVEEIAPTREMLLQSSQGIVPPALQVVEGQSHAPGENVFYLLRRQAVMTGRDLKTARVGVGDQGEPNVQFTLDAAGAARFKQETGRNIGRRLAIVLDERVTSAPLIEQPVGAEGRIRGHFTAAEADDLAKVLRAGALPAKMRYVQELTVGASLGRDSIRAGLIASAAALLFVTVFMLAYYRLSGLNAVVALAANLLILLAAMAYIGATLTLPGIAGIILTMGVGVDTNVLVFERIREELRHGKTVRAAVLGGFDRVWITILDTHATVLIAAAFLFQFGTGPIRGFAVTLVMGLIANVFASYFVSKLLFEWVLGRGQVSTLSI
ncbi:MAG TPA: protein translocase subunit SecD [Vicinamibacteria bacterium]|nr:protein translocase subunit SecD [Vicinamibacteria bacterium]